VTRDQNPVRARLVQTEERFRVHRERQGVNLNRAAMTSDNAARRIGNDRMLMALVHGWQGNADVELAEMAAQGEWLEPLRAAANAPLMPADDPRDETLTTSPTAAKLRPSARGSRSSPCTGNHSGGTRKRSTCSCNCSACVVASK